MGFAGAVDDASWDDLPREVRERLGEPTRFEPVLRHGAGSVVRLDAIARQSGLGAATNLRIQLKRSIGLTPSDYRRRFTLSRSAG